MKVSCSTSCWWWFLASSPRSGGSIFYWDGVSALRYNNEMVGSMGASCNTKIAVLLFSLNVIFSLVTPLLFVGIAVGSRHQYYGVRDKDDNLL